MCHVHPGRTGLQVSRLCLGTMNFGRQTGEPECHAVLDRAVEPGRTFGMSARQIIASRAGVTAPVPGPRTPEQLDLPMLALDTELSAETLDELDRTSPPVGNGGPGPEAWVW